VAVAGSATPFRAGDAGRAGRRVAVSVVGQAVPAMPVRATTGAPATKGRAGA